MTTRSQKPLALVIGGSLAGLFTANLLDQAGWDVEIFERSPQDLDSRGGGIVLQPDIVEVFRRTGIDVESMSLGVRSRDRTVFRPDGSIQSKQFAPQTQTSWSLIYTILRASFGEDRYHQGMALVGLDQDPSAATVTAHFADGTHLHTAFREASDRQDEGRIGPAPQNRKRERRRSRFLCLTDLVHAHGARRPSTLVTSKNRRQAPLPDLSA